MSLESVALASSVLQGRQQISIAAVKQAAQSQQAIVELIAQTTGSQPLNSSGRGSNVNVLA
ncbi:hypothetical protein [Hwanghaeella sp.]|uniref:hypothetical protein n=1 Tax=Hwanghaeella sp. TaxID=2605943 RepID=UPI003CCBBC3E